MSAGLDKGRILFFAATVLVGGVVAWIAQPLMRGNDDAIALIATIFSILAGLLIGIITLLADPALLPGETWRGAVLGKRVIQRRLHRHRLLFVVYLGTLVLILVAALIDHFPVILQWIERAYLFLATVGFLYSFRLPWTLAKVQEDRLDAVVQERRREAGLSD